MKTPSQRTPSQLIYDFCKSNKICVTCKVKFTDGVNLKCEPCRITWNAYQRKYDKKKSKNLTI